MEGSQERLSGSRDRGRGEAPEGCRHHLQTRSGSCQESQEQEAGQGREDGSYDDHTAAPSARPCVNGVGILSCTHRNHSEAADLPHSSSALKTWLPHGPREPAEPIYLGHFPPQPESAIAGSSTLDSPSRTFPPVPYHRQISGFTSSPSYSLQPGIEGLQMTVTCHLTQLPW